MALSLARSTLLVLMTLVLAARHLPRPQAQGPPPLPELTHKRLLNDLQLIVAATPYLGDGMTIGLVQQMSTLILPTQLQNAAIFVVFLLIIFFRPQGFFGRMVERT